MGIGNRSCLALFASFTWLALLVLAARAGAGEEVVVFVATRDATLIESLGGDLANGAGPALFAGSTSQSVAPRRRALLAFDVAAAIPAGARVVRAELVLHLTPSNPATAGVSLHRALADWSEGASAASGGGGAPAQPGDVTWLHAAGPDRFWSAAGGDFAAFASAAATVGDVGAYRFAGPGLAADVQAWLDDPAQSFGWVVRGDETLPTTAKRFASRESAEPGERPALVVGFERAADACDAAPRGGAHAMCHAYCEALECDEGSPRGSPKACAALADAYSGASGGTPPPCIDADRDGVEDALDVCPSRPDPDQADADLDGVGDACDDCSLEPNPGQEETFGALALGDACDCPCFSTIGLARLLGELTDAATYAGLACIDTRPAKPLTAVLAVRLDGAACSAGGIDCSALAVSFTEDEACQLNPPLPEPPISFQGIDAAQREGCRLHILDVAGSAGLGCH